MEYQSIPHDRIIAAFERNVPGCYVRDYQSNDGFIVICKGYRNIKWRDQLSTAKVERQIPATTLMNLPRGNVTRPSLFDGARLVRPGWQIEFRRAAPFLSESQKRRITRDLKAGEIFPGIR